MNKTIEKSFELNVKSKIKKDVNHYTSNYIKKNLKKHEKTLTNKHIIGFIMLKKDFYPKNQIKKHDLDDD